MNAVVNVLKPAGMTSHDAVYLLRRLTGVKRVGHTGTLDPMAAGVLPVCIGSAARINEYLDMDRKGYRCEMILGLETDTLDIWGKVLTDRRDQVRGITEDQVLRIMEPMEGLVMQTPPQYSAIRVDGRRLYDYARSGKTVEVPSRPVVIYQLRLIRLDLRRGRLMFDVVCSKGTYVRSICSEIGRNLGVGGAMSFLVRTRSGAFTLENAATPEQLADNLEAYLLPADFPLQQLGRLDLCVGRGTWFSNGGWLIGRDIASRKEPFADGNACGEDSVAAVANHLKISPRLFATYRVYEEQKFLGTAVWDEKQQKFIADKVFHNDNI